jgi:alpha-galactosidase
MFLVRCPSGFAGEADIRTPPIPAAPRINGARIFGARPGHPFFFHVPVSGQRPLTVTATGLPAGLALDPGTGNISGSTGVAGSYSVALTARNAMGEAHSMLQIVIGDSISLTPAMGWNSWNCYGRNVTEAQVSAAADAMVKSGLIDHGWTYINVDDGWQGKRDSTGVITGNGHFPDISSGLEQYVHAQGLKFGIYTSPGPTTCAGFTGSRGHEQLDADTYAKWGVDYVKYDLCSGKEQIDHQILDAASALLPPDKAAIYRKLYKQWSELDRARGLALGNLPPASQAHLDNLAAQLASLIDPARLQQDTLAANMAPFALFGRALSTEPRDMAYSISSHGRAEIWKWGPEVGANSWRTTYDIRNDWKSVSFTGFSQYDKSPYARPGHWNDPDMLEIGNGVLTADESYTHMTLWCMLSAPLLIGCDMTKMSDFTRSLFTNDEVIAVDQDPLGGEATRVKQEGATEVWIKPLAGGATAVALFNRSNTMAQVGISWRQLNLPIPPTVRDLWRQKDIPVSGSDLNVPVAPHGAELFRVQRTE